MKFEFEFAVALARPLPPSPPSVGKFVSSANISPHLLGFPLNPNTFFPQIIIMVPVKDHSSPGETIEHLPDVCLLTVFKKIPVCEQFFLGDVCQRWKVLIKSVLCSRRKLTIFVGTNPVVLLKPTSDSNLKMISPDDTLYLEYIEKSTVHLTHLDDKTVQRLVRTFPNITDVTFSLKNVKPDVISHVITLLSNWAPKLTSLTFYSQFLFDTLSLETIENSRTVISACQFELLDAINTLPRVFKLTLDFSNTFISYDHCYYVPGNKRTRIDLPILSQLTEFNFSSGDHATFLYDSFKLYALPNKQLKCIRLHNHIGRIATWKKYLQFDLSFLSRFKQIHLHLDGDNTPLIYVPLMSAMSSVTFLNIYVENDITYPKLLVCLAKLKNLTSLKLQINFDSFSNGTEKTPKSFANLPRLLNVTELTLPVYTDSHDDFLSVLHLEHVFPNLKMFNATFNIFYCEDCEYNNVDYHHINFEYDTDDEDSLSEPPIPRELRNCARQMSAQFADFKFPKSITFEWPDLGIELNYDQLFQGKAKESA